MNQFLIGIEVRIDSMSRDEIMYVLKETYPRGCSGCVDDRVIITDFTDERKPLIFPCVTAQHTHMNSIFCQQLCKGAYAVKTTWAPRRYQDVTPITNVYMSLPPRAA